MYERIFTWTQSSMTFCSLLRDPKPQAVMLPRHQQDMIRPTLKTGSPNKAFAGLGMWFCGLPKKGPQKFQARSIRNNQRCERLKPLGTERERKRRAGTRVWRTNVSPQILPFYYMFQILKTLVPRRGSKFPFQNIALAEIKIHFDYATTTNWLRLRFCRSQSLRFLSKSHSSRTFPICLVHTRNRALSEAWF